MINILDYGAVGDGRSKCTDSFAAAIAAARVSKQTVLVPPGTYLTGTINLHGVSMHIAGGAVIKASPEIKDYPEQAYDHNELGVLRCLMFSLGGDAVVIDGHGTIDLSGRSFFDEHSPIIPDSRVPFTPEQIQECTLNREDRPTLSLFFHEMTNVTIKDLTIVDAPCWCITFANSTNVRINGLTIRTDLNVPNGDGIHISSCRDVRISDCDILSGDDCIALTGITTWEKPCENIVISDCILETRSKAIALGYIYSHVRNVLIQNVIINRSNRGLCFMVHPGIGLVENVRIKNILIDTRIAAGNWWGNGEPIFFMAVDHDGHIPSEQKPGRVTAVSYRNIHIDGVTCLAENAIALINEGGLFENVAISDLDFTMKDSLNLPLKGRIADVAPSRDTYEIPENCAVYVKGTSYVSLHKIRAGALSVIIE